jgi:RimJ/RimL family protein N-acetyltransferase
MKTFIIGHDIEVATWAFQTFNFHPTEFCMAIGIAESGKGLVAACLFHAHNGPDVELSYYGPGTVTLPIVRGLAKIAVEYLGVSRITARTSRANKRVTRGIKGLGFEFEGIRKCGYGDQDAVMYGLFGKNLARLAGRALH